MITRLFMLFAAFFCFLLGAVVRSFVVSTIAEEVKEIYETLVLIFWAPNSN